MVRAGDKCQAAAEINSFELKYFAFIYLHIFGVVRINIDT